MTSSPELPPSLLQTTPWNPENQAIWIATSMILRRNLARYNFPSKLQGPEVGQVIETLKNALLKNSDIEHPRYYDQKQLSSSDRELIFEHFHFLHGFQEPPDGSGIVLDQRGLFLSLINMGNHLEMYSLSLNNHWENAWDQLNQLESHIGKTHDFAFSPKFGYLTSELSQCGTGLTVHAYLHLPALILSNQIDSALDNAEEDEILFLGLSGDLDELIGDLIIVENNYTLGVSEEAILHSIQTAATKLIGAEKTMRAHLKEELNTEIKDRISKGFGLIVHSLQLETKEALDLLSLMKLGLALGYITGVSDQKLNELFLKSRRGHLVHLFPDLKEPKDIEQKRAQFLQQELQGIALT